MVSWRWYRGGGVDEKWKVNTHAEYEELIARLKKESE